MRPLQVYIGFDPRESVAINVLTHSIQRRASVPVAVTWLALHQLREVHKRKRDPLQSNDFSFIRFLAPWLAGIEGGQVSRPVLFMDCDMLCLCDIAELFDLFDHEYAVQVVKHDYEPVDKDTKYLDAPQRTYKRKNWSSLMLMQPSMCWNLSAETVDQSPGLFLHQFGWLDDDSLIGALPKGYNYLVGEENQCPVDEVKIVHFTRGGPWFTEYDGCEFSRAWHLERDDMLRADQRGGK